MPVRPQEQALAAAALIDGLGADAPIGFAIHDADLRFVAVSPSLAAFNGRPVADHIGRRIPEMVPGDLGEKVEALMAEVRGGSEPRIGLEIQGRVAAPGDVRIWVAAYYPFTLGDDPHVGAVVVEVTERRRAQEATRESERALSGAQRMAGLGWWTWYADPEQIVYSPELLGLLGRDEGLGGVPLERDQLGMSAEELAGVRADGHECLRTGSPFARRVHARHANGEPRLLEARADVVHDADGRAVGLQGFVQDITLLDRAERRQRVVARIGQDALEGVDLDELLRRVVDAAGHEVGVDGAAVLELLPSGTEATVRAAIVPPGFAGPWTVPREPGSAVDHALSTGQAVIVDDLEGEHPYVRSEADIAAGARSIAAVVIGGRANPFGLLAAMSVRPSHFGADDAAFLQALANAIADAVERRTVEAEIAELSAARGRLVGQALDGEERARRRIAEDLHDGPLQELVLAGHDLYALLGRGGDDAAVAAVRERLTAIIRQLRDVMSALHPTVLQYAGLEAALQAVADQQSGLAGFEAEVAVDGEATRVRDELLLSVARELIGNAARHAQATRVGVEVRREGGDVVLVVADDGTGMAPGALEQAVARGAIGLAACRERVEAVGGKLVIASEPAAGTRVRARIPTGPVPERKTGISSLGVRPERE